MTDKFRFSHGRLLLDDGSPDEPDIVQQFTSSNGTTVYTAVRWKKSQRCSCNCPGWAFRKECKHSKKAAVAEMSNYIGVDPGLMGGSVPLAAGQRQARSLRFDEVTDDT
jgi:hypothetical protein